MDLPNKVIVKQKVEPIEIFTGFETKNRYRIISETGQELLFAYEESNFFAKQFLGMIRPLKMHFIDNSKNEMFSFERKLFFIRARQEVRNNSGPIGSINQKKWFLSASFEVLVNNQVKYTIEMKFPHIWTYNIMQNGQQVGQIKKKWSGIGKEMFTDADNFLVDFGTIDSKDRSLLLAGALVVDVRNFERKK